MKNLIEQGKLKELFTYILETEGEYLPLQFVENRLTEEDEKATNLEKTIISTGFGETLAIEDWQQATTLEELYYQIKDCKKCKFGKTRNKFVFGVGNPKAEIMLVGEAPGAEEDQKGEPFVGAAGQLLDKILKAINLDRSIVYIANVVKCRPPLNKTPTEEEYSPCFPYLVKQIELIKPKFMLLLGAVALQALFGKNYKITQWRGKIIDYKGIKVIPTYHPAYLLRNPNAKKDVWIDVQLLQQLYLNYKQNKENR